MGTKRHVRRPLVSANCARSIGRCLLLPSFLGLLLVPSEPLVEFQTHSYERGHNFLHRDRETIDGVYHVMSDRAGLERAGNFD